MSHSHHSSDLNFNKQFKIGIVLNLLFVIIELLIGIVYNSLALISDAGHNFSDVISLLIAWGAGYLVQKKPTREFTYGLKKSSIIGAQLNSLILLVAIGIIIWEAINRLNRTPEVEGEVLMLVAGIGVIINGITTYLFLSGKNADLNIKGAYLHMLADTLISFGVVVSGLIIYFTSFFWIDPLISIIISFAVFWSTFKLLRDSTKLSLDAVPASINIDAVKDFLISHDEIKGYHHLHIWALSTTESALTVHITIDNLNESEKILKNIQKDFRNKFGISHCTIQVEKMECSTNC